MRDAEMNAKAAATRLRGLAQMIDNGDVTLADLIREAEGTFGADWLANLLRLLPGALRARADQLAPLP